MSNQNLNITKTIDGKIYIEGTSQPIKVILHTKLSCRVLSITLDNVLSGEPNVDSKIISALKYSFEKNFQMSADIQLNTHTISSADVVKIEVLDHANNLLGTVYNDKVLCQ